MPGWRCGSIWRGRGFGGGGFCSGGLGVLLGRIGFCSAGLGSAWLGWGCARPGWGSARLGWGSARPGVHSVPHAGRRPWSRRSRRAARSAVSPCRPLGGVDVPPARRCRRDRTPGSGTAATALSNSWGGGAAGTTRRRHPHRRERPAWLGARRSARKPVSATSVPNSEPTTPHRPLPACVISAVRPMSVAGDMFDSVPRGLAVAREWRYPGVTVSRYRGSGAGDRGGASGRLRSYPQIEHIYESVSGR